MATNRYYDGSSSYHGPVYTSVSGPYTPGEPLNEPSPSEYDEWWHDDPDLAPKVEHYKSVLGQWVLVGCYNTATESYIPLDASPPYLNEHLGGAVPDGPEPRLWFDDRVCPGVMMVWDPCAAGGDGDYVQLGSSAPAPEPGTTPQVQSTALVGGPTFATGQQICIDVQFDQDVLVTGAPLIAGGQWEQDGPLTQVPLVDAIADGATQPNLFDGDDQTGWLSSVAGTQVTGNLYSSATQTIDVQVGSVPMNNAFVWMNSDADPAANGSPVAQFVTVLGSTDGVTYAPLPGDGTTNFWDYWYDKHTGGPGGLPRPGAGTANTFTYYRLELDQYYTTNASGFLWLNELSVYHFPLVTGAAPALTYVSGSGTDTLRFCYTVEAGDQATGFDIVGGAITLPAGASIVSSVGGNNANLTLPTINESVVIN